MSQEQLWSYMPIAGVLLLGLLLSAMIPSKRRQEAEAREAEEDDDDDDEDDEDDD